MGGLEVRRGHVRQDSKPASDHSSTEPPSLLTLTPAAQQVVGVLIEEGRTGSGTREETYSRNRKVGREGEREGRKRGEHTGWYPPTVFRNPSYSSLVPSLPPSLPPPSLPPSLPPVSFTHGTDRGCSRSGTD